ncbi:PepSY domain-containing protein [Reyranella sp.]|uniref:PepSY domain-containing protein n=1 Tax=Reyranella sp. TaxID=1929291 RepID=UPI0025D2516C|nr:PepSY domain-containing protein [Reyranella sp.]
MIAAILSSALVSSAVLAREDDCKVPMAQWQPREAVEQMAKAQGWTVRRLKVDDGCYQIRGTDAEGREIAVKVDPGSLAIVRMKHRNGRGDGDDGRRSAVPEHPLPGTPAPPANELLKGTTPPKAEIQ